MKDRFLTRKEAAKYLNERGLTYSANTLQKFATTGGGPRYQIFGIRAVYTIHDLDNWIDSKLSDPHTSAA